ncbi:general stress protein [uncultured Pseudokineococcus sp.]|uniref:general stress protein n=1 Tax=uncultured Pseudokineococcus sp. TaxID=1642928 RepID=UPI0026070324|nr:general stress protein [uncultured Pseudokineococcus sp.]
MASSFTSPRDRRQGMPTAPTGEEVASYDTYAAAQAAVDFLSDEQFPVQHVTIVGTDLRMVERVLGRLTYGRVAGAGLASGAWIGLLIGLILVLLTPPEAGLLAILPAVLIGAAFGLILSLVSYAATRGRRDFTSVSQIVASRYALFCTQEQMGAAREVLGRDADAARGLGRPGWGGAAQPARVQAPQSPAPGAGASEGTASAPVASGPTYSEMVARQREEERVRAEGEDQQPR